MAMGQGGVPDIGPTETWAALRDDPLAALVDVRTDAEWNFVGIPELGQLGKQVVLIPWQVYPTMQVNGAFADHLAKAGLTPEHQHLLHLPLRRAQPGGRGGGSGRGLPARLQRRRRLRGAGGRRRPSRHRRRLEGRGPALAAAVEQRIT